MAGFADRAESTDGTHLAGRLWGWAGMPLALISYLREGSASTSSITSFLQAFSDRCREIAKTHAIPSLSQDASHELIPCCGTGGRQHGPKQAQSQAPPYSAPALRSGSFQDRSAQRPDFASISADL